jgi:hypothetical protein
MYVHRIAAGNQLDNAAADQFIRSDGLLPEICLPRVCMILFLLKTFSITAQPLLGQKEGDNSERSVLLKKR